MVAEGDTRGGVTAELTAGDPSTENSAGCGGDSTRVYRRHEPEQGAVRTGSAAEACSLHSWGPGCPVTIQRREGLWVVHKPPSAPTPLREERPIPGAS